MNVVGTAAKPRGLIVKFDDHGCSFWRRWFGRRDAKRIILSIQDADHKGYITFMPDSRTGRMDVKFSQAKPHKLAGDFETDHQLGALDDLKLAKLALGLRWWQSPWSVRGLVRLLNGQTRALTAATTAAAKPKPGAFRPVSVPVNTGISGAKDAG